MLYHIMFQERKFNGNFQIQAQKQSVSPSLLSFLRMLLNGPNLNENSQVATSELSMSQLLTFNAVKRQRNIERIDQHVRQCDITLHRRRLFPSILRCYCIVMVETEN